MALSDKIFESGQYHDYLISQLGDVPSNLSASDLKARFDYISEHIIMPRVNEIIANLINKSASDCGAANIGCAPLATESGETVYSNLIYLRDWISDLIIEALEIPVGGVTDEALSKNSDQLFARFAAHASGMGHFITGTTTGSATAYTFASPPLLWDNLEHSDHFFIIKPNVDCAANATIVMCGSTALTITPCFGGGLTAGQMKSSGQYLLYWNSTSNYLFILNPETRTHSHSDSPIPIASVANLTTELSGKALSGHNHDSAYSPVAHNHNSTYIGVGASCNKAWNWSGQGGQPSWLWGGNDGTNMYVYNPSNFSVNYANSAGSAGSAGSATNATNAVNADVWDGAHLIYSAATPSYVAGAVWLKPI